MVDDAFLSSDESQLFDNLDARLRFDHTQIHKRVDDEVEKINQRFLREVNVLDFGAKGDGKADDTKAIQDAMNLAEKDKFIKITFPHGVFKITSTLRVKMNTHLHLSEQTTILKEFGGYMLANGMPDDEFTKYDGNSNITVDGGVWDYNGVKFPQMANCFAFGHSQNIVFKNLTIKDVAGSHAIELNSSREVQFLNCKFLGFIDTGGRSFSEAIQLDLAKGAGYFGAFGGYDNTQCHNVLVQGCYFGESGTRGSGAWPRGVGSHAATIGRWHSYITIVDNIFENLTMQAIRAFSWNHLIVSNNHIINCGSAVNVVPPKHSSNPNNTIDVDGVQTNKSQNVYNFKITNNLIRGGGAHSSSIRIQSEKDVWIYGVVVSGNTISQKQGNTVGVYLRGVSRAVVSNNVIHENQASGLSLRDCYSLVVDGNSLTNIGTNAISANGVQMLTISGNSIDYCGGKGMSIQACQQATISGNSVKRTTTYGIHIHTNSLGFTISGNTIIGSGRKNPGEAGSQCIRITTNSSNGAVTGNLLRGWGEDYEPSYGIWVTATTYRIFVTGNNSPGLDAYFSGNQPSSNKHTANSWN
nr:right-handed parallel beta-helix repeat-containing protein [Virgibacillus halotolerans]